MFSDAQLEALLAVARRNNQRDHISGLLMYHDGSFLQVLEGEREAVEACITRIAANPNHTQFLRLVQGEVPDRLFPAWSMGFARPEDLGDADGLTGLDRVLEELPRLRGLDRQVATLIRSFFATHSDYLARLTV
ncbi:BLUF domain-containing protein [Pseudophaeobacter sp. MA21411-1]|nr:BLUF domain-containing protein [Pseudophaeobacter flagellatus]